MKILSRNISRDGAGFVIGSEATSTGYVSDSVDGYDKCKGLESEHGRSDQDHSDRHDCDHHDRSCDHDRSVGVHPESFCSINSRDNISKQVLMMHWTPQEIPSLYVSSMFLSIALIDTF